MARFLLILLCFFLVIQIGFTHWVSNRIYPFLAFQDIGVAAAPKEFLTLTEKEQIGQGFLCNFPNLSGIGFFIEKLPQQQDGVLVMGLREHFTDKKDLVSVSVPVKQIKPQRRYYQYPIQERDYPEGGFFYIEFNPLENSKKKEYYFYLELLKTADGLNPSSMRIGKIRSSQGYRGLSKGALFLNGEPSDGVLSFVTVCAWTGDWRGVFGHFKEGLRRDKPFAIFYFSLLVLVSSMLIGTFRPKKQH